MATRSADKDLENGIKVALDAADTASGVTEEFNNVREQFEVVNIQAKRIYQSVLIIFVSAIVAAIISIGAGLLMYYKALGTLRTNSNMAIESLAIFTENVAKLDKSIQLIESNTENQELIKSTLVDLEAAAKQSIDDITGAEVKYSKAVKLTIQEVQGLIQQFATTTLESIEARTQQTQGQLAQQMSNMEKFFVQADTSKEGDDNRGDSIVTYKQFQALENKVDQLIMLQKDLVAKIFEMNQAAKVAAKKKAVAKKVTRKPAPNPLKFP